LNRISDILQKEKCTSLILFTGKSSYHSSGADQVIPKMLSDLNIRYEHYSVSGEPSPDFVDKTAAAAGALSPQYILSVGGGSVIDAGKAVSAMLKADKPVKTYLEGVGTESPPGEKVPFIAVPTTSGTGSEATKNAVLSEVGKNGFKKSLRHDNYVPDYAVIDPELMLTCPVKITAPSGLDAITQLVEAYVSTKANPVTDAYVEAGLKSAGRWFDDACREGAESIEAREGMAFAAFCSGVALANAGLGVVHGIAGLVGGLYPASHGVLCGTVMGPATKLIVKKLRELGKPGLRGLKKYGQAGVFITGEDRGSDSENADNFAEKIQLWIHEFSLPGLGSFGIDAESCKYLASKAGLKNTPVELSPDEIAEILEASL